MRKTVQTYQEIKKHFPNLELSEDQISKLDRYLQLLVQWNKKINLTAIRDESQMFVKHVLDSLAVLKLPEQSPSSLAKMGKTLDMGSGAGLPSIILAIIAPNIQITSVDKVKKKIGFQDFVKAQLKLSNFFPMAVRLDALAQDPQHKNQYDCLITRAFDQMTGILEFGQQFLKEDGSLILWKGASWKQEWEATPEALRNRYRIEETVTYQFEQFNCGGTMLVIRRIS